MFWLKLPLYSLIKTIGQYTYRILESITFQSIYPYTENRAFLDVRPSHEFILTEIQHRHFVFIFSHLFLCLAYLAPKLRKIYYYAVSLM